MKLKYYSIPFLIAFVACCIHACKGQQKTLSGVIIFAQGDVTIIQNDVNKPAGIGANVNPNDIIATGNQSIAVVQIADRAIAHIGSNSRVVVQSLLDTSVTLYLEKGEVISKVERLQKGQEYSVKARSVVASVRGTQFLVKADEKIGKVAVHTGSVSVKPIIEAEEVEVAEIKETIVEGGKEAIVTVEEEKVAKEVPVTVQEISVKDKMKIETAAKIEVVPQEVLAKPESLEKVQETIKQNVEKIEKIETLSESEIKQQIKKERIERLMQQKTRTLEEIKEACERIDVVKLYSGKTIQGAIIDRTNDYKILTTTGVVEVPKKNVRSVSVLR
ncbi:MAG TPA: FecR domain-containing protein [Spirochaetota bacterium]|nr:FecR domain-containing protein [Spirochaetota bacterium]HOM09278.1 FecR domain-containing protein [Spirochaetota bacterium]HPP50850.1 FecR domain-containing protein [Spirochaetota bacterium]